MTAVVSLGKTLNLMPVCEWNENPKTHVQCGNVEKVSKEKNRF